MSDIAKVYHKPLAATNNVSMILNLVLNIFSCARPLHLCIESWNVAIVKRWLTVALQEEIYEAIDIPSPTGTALCMAAALKKDREIGNFQCQVLHLMNILC